MILKQYYFAACFALLFLLFIIEKYKYEIKILTQLRDCFSQCDHIFILYIYIIYILYISIISSFKDSTEIKWIIYNWMI